MANKSEDIKLVGKYQFYFETPLYEVVRFEDGLFGGAVDAFSAKNQSDTTYRIESFIMDDGIYPNYFKIFKKVRLLCKRKGDDALYFFIFDLGDNLALKVGQTPSLAEIQFGELGKKYNKLLSREDLQLYRKAIGLAAHGVGAGSFVYLRRIFEDLIYKTFEDAKESLGLSEEEFRKKRMNEKVETLKVHLPTQLVEMSALYAILSKGVHELSEQECLRYFKVLKLAIDLVLEQRIENEVKKKRDAEVKRQLKEIEDELKG